MVCFRFIGFFMTALALAGCCGSGSGCYVPVPGVPTAWDGAGARPGERTAPERQARIARPKTEIVAGPVVQTPGEATPQPELSHSVRSAPGDSWAQGEVADRDAEATLAKRLMICRNCLPSARAGATTEVVGGLR